MNPFQIQKMNQFDQSLRKTVPSLRDTLTSKRVHAICHSILKLNVSQSLKKIIEKQLGFERKY